MASSAKVKRYTCMYSSQVNKKHKTYQDGFIRHHHSNSRIYLLSMSNDELAQSFYKPSQKAVHDLSDVFNLEEGAEFEFEDQGYHVLIGDFESERETDMEAIRSSTLKAKTERSAAAKEWAKSQDSQTRASTITTFPVPSTSSVTPSIVQKAGYRGFSISPPKSYLQATSLAGKNAIEKGKNRPNPYSANTTPMKASASNSTSTPVIATRYSQASMASNLLSSGTPPSIGARAGFKPPRPSTMPRLKSAFSEFNR